MVTDYFSKWLFDFTIRNPDESFLQMGIEDDSIVTNILSPLDFLIKTLEIFGLPKNYMQGGGHHLNWDKKALEATNTRSKKKKNQPTKGKSQKLKEA